MAAKAEILHLIIEEENVSEAASDLWGVIEMLQEIILKTSISAPNFVSNRPVIAFITTHLGAEVIELSSLLHQLRPTVHAGPALMA